MEKIKPEHSIERIQIFFDNIDFTKLLKDINTPFYEQLADYIVYNEDNFIHFWKENPSLSFIDILIEKFKVEGIEEYKTISDFEWLEKQQVPKEKYILCDMTRCTIERYEGFMLASELSVLECLDIYYDYMWDDKLPEPDLERILRDKIMRDCPLYKGMDQYGDSSKKIFSRAVKRQLDVIKKVLFLKLLEDDIQLKRYCKILLWGLKIYKKSFFTYFFRPGKVAKQIYTKIISNRETIKDIARQSNYDIPLVSILQSLNIIEIKDNEAHQEFNEEEEKAWKLKVKFELFRIVGKKA